MSHFQQHLKAVQPKDKIPSPTASITRKPANSSYIPITPQSSNTSPARTTYPMDRVKNGAYTPAHAGPPSAPHTPPSILSSAPQPLSSHLLPVTQPSPATTSPPAVSSTPTRATPGAPLTAPQIDTALQTALTLQTVATTQHSKRPFAAILLAPDNTTLLLTHFSLSHVRHAESELARLASDHFSIPYLSTCTLVSTWEPCAMCAGTIYWSGIGRVVYAASEENLSRLTGSGNEENMTMSMPCRKVFDAGQRRVEVVGPVPGWEKRVVEESGKWWKDHDGKEASVKENGNLNHNGLGHVQGDKASTAASTWTGEESVLSSIGEDGEYTADLDIDWMR